MKRLLGTMKPPLLPLLEVDQWQWEGKGAESRLFAEDILGWKPPPPRQHFWLLCHLVCLISRILLGCWEMGHPGKRWQLPEETNTVLKQSAFVSFQRQGKESEALALTRCCFNFNFHVQAEQN